MNPEDITLEEVGQAVTELRKEIEKKSLDSDKVQRIQEFLDLQEEKNQLQVQRDQEQKQIKEELKELKTKLEESGVSETKAQERIDALEAEIARRSDADKATEDYHESQEFKALNKFCQVGYDMLDAELKASLRTDSDVQGGFLTTTEMDSEITKKITEIDGIRAVARVRTVASKAMEVPVRNTIPVAQFEGETEQGPESNPTYENETITPFRQTYTVPITQDMLMDASFNMEAEISADAAEAFGFGEGNGFVVGSGFKQPSGFMTHSVLQANARVTSSSGVLDADSIILITGDLKVGYDPVYVLNRRTLAFIRTLKATTGQFLWQPGLNGPVANTLNGFPYVIANSVADIASSAFVLAFGDFRRGYTIVDRAGMSVIRDEFTQKRKAIVEFTMNRWVTGQVTLPEAIQLLQVAA